MHMGIKGHKGPDRLEVRGELLFSHLQLPRAGSWRALFMLQYDNKCALKSQKLFLDLYFWDYKKKHTTEICWITMYATFFISTLGVLNPFFFPA